MCASRYRNLNDAVAICSILGIIYLNRCIRFNKYEGQVTLCRVGKADRSCRFHFQALGQGQTVVRNSPLVGCQITSDSVEAAVLAVCSKVMNLCTGWSRCFALLAAGCSSRLYSCCRGGCGWILSSGGCRCNNWGIAVAEVIAHCSICTIGLCFIQTAQIQRAICISPNLVEICSLFRSFCQCDEVGSGWTCKLRADLCSVGDSGIGFNQIITAVVVNTVVVSTNVLIIGCTALQLCI